MNKISVQQYFIFKMLCEVTPYGLFAVWATMTILGLLSMLILSGAIFYPYYVKPTFDLWQLKNNPTFPSPNLVKKEIIHMCKGLFVATLCPAFTLFLSDWKMSKGYCGMDSYSTILYQSLLIFGFTDLFEYAYHWAGHRYDLLWNIHRHHHKFYNPSPFAVIADEWADQFVRTLPMVILPAVVPINMDLMFLIFASLFYGYGVYLHWGYESTLLTAHNPIFNTAYHHYMHHAISAKNRPVYTGFFFKLWDNVFLTRYEDLEDDVDDGLKNKNNNKSSPRKKTCQCYLCRPKRSLADWNNCKKPDYSVLLSVKWWFTSEMKDE